MRITYYDNKLILDCPYDPITVAKIKTVPDKRWNKKDRVWEFKPVMEVINHIRALFPSALWTDKAEAFYQDLLQTQTYRDAVASGQVDTSNPLEGVPMKMPPYEHQRKALVLGRDQDVFAYLMDQGTGKTKTLLDDCAHNFRLGKIDGLVIICPNSVKTNWVNNDPEAEPDEVTKHLAPDIPVVKGVWYSGATAAQRQSWDLFWSCLGEKSILMVLAVNVESMHVDRVVDVLQEFVTKRRCMIVVDESTRIKNRTAKRTKGCVKVRKKCPMARIMSGTPLIKSPLNAYSQFGFLDPNILGFATYASFQARFAVTGGYQGRQVLYYRNTEELSQKIAGVSFRVTKEQCLDLPAKVYPPKRIVEMTAEQARLYKTMREEMIAWLDEQTCVTASLVLTQLLRLQQITSGHLPILDPVTGQQTGVKSINEISPKVEEAMDIIEDCDGKVIVWCRFKFEIKEMSAQLTKAGIKHVLFYGEVSEADRLTGRTAFQNDPATKVFVGQSRTGGIGITLTAASTVIYLSNSFSTEDRIQSEDRAHRIGQTKSVTYFDLVCPRTIDTKIIQVLRANKNMADEIMRDDVKAWI